MRFERLKPMYDRLSEEMKSSPYGQVITQRYRDAKITAVGEIAPDFTLLTPEGDSLSLYSVKAKVKVLDFWASWCGPCLREVPNVKKVYDKFHDKGFEILSVSLDDKKDNWVNAIEKNDLDWGHVSSLKGWSCPVAKLYNVSGVPAMLLIDKEGKIVATKLRGDLLMEKVAEQFGE